MDMQPAALNDRERNALLEALDDEYMAWATYDQVIRDFGPVRPFINIREAEGRHIAALTRAFQRYHIPLPPNRWIGKAKRFSNIAEACRAGVEAEIANAALYESLMSSTSRPDLLKVYRRLQEASQARHLPAFRRGAAG